MRNHGFLYEWQLGWRLSPVYDLNPTPVEMKPRILTTAVNFDDNSASLDVALSVVYNFRLSKGEDYAVIRDVAKAVFEKSLTRSKSKRAFVKSDMSFPPSAISNSTPKGIND